MCRIFLPIFLLATLLGCRTHPTQDTSRQSGEREAFAPEKLAAAWSADKLLFLDSLQATQAITTDPQEKFFEKIAALDMSIQMRRNYSSQVSRDSILRDYQTFLKREVLSFSREEKTFIEKIFSDIFYSLDSICPAVFPKQLGFIKTHGNHYGSSVYYTRDHYIIIPKYALESPSHQGFRAIMLHELFHVYSRLNPKKRAELYALIGFRPLAKGSELMMSDSLQKRLLLNPDGIDPGWVISLQTDKGNQIFAIPLILSKQLQYNSAQPSFFSYLQFDLYQIQPPLSRLAKVEALADGRSTINWLEIPDFRKQIGDNTDYIIHPDEILADNFMHWVHTKEQPGQREQFSAEGRALLHQIEQVLQY